MNSKRKVSIIIPFYNAKLSVSKTLKSILNQTYRNIELILINDCSTDDSLEVARRFEEAFLEKGVGFKLYSHDVNKGVAAARNTGLVHMSGDFVFFLDADDWIELDAIEVLVTEAVRSSADIVGCNWFLSFKKKERKMSQPEFFTPWEAIYLILCGQMRWNLWMFLIKRDLFFQNQIQFIPGKNMGEDLLVTIKLLLKAEKVSFVNRNLCHYNQSNEKSITKIYSEDHVSEVSYNIKEVEKALLSSQYSSRIKNEIYYLKLNIKLPMLISGSTEQYRRWLKWFPESHPYISENRLTPWRTRFLQKSALKRQFWVIKLYYFLIIRTIYGVVFR